MLRDLGGAAQAEKMEKMDFSPPAMDAPYSFSPPTERSRTFSWISPIIENGLNHNLHVLDFKVEGEWKALDDTSPQASEDDGINFRGASNSRQRNIDAVQKFQTQPLLLQLIPRHGKV